MMLIKVNDPTIAAAGADAPSLVRPESTSRQDPRDPLHAPAAALLAALIGRADELSDYASNLTGELERAVRAYVPEDQWVGLFDDLRGALSHASDAFADMREMGVEIERWSRGIAPTDRTLP